MKLLTKETRRRLLRNGRLRKEFTEAGCREPDFAPDVKLFTPDADCTWLLTELDPEDTDIAFGPRDLGMGCPELGSVRISELEGAHGRLGLPVERDRYFWPDRPLSTYAKEAHVAGRIRA